MLAPWKKRCDKPTQNIKKQRHYFVDKGLYSQSYGFSNSHLQIWELDRKEGWVPKNWCSQNVVLQKTLESPLDYKEIKPVNPKGNQAWIFTGRTGPEAPILWPPDAKSWLIGKDPDAGKDWSQKGLVEDEMVTSITSSMDRSLRNIWVIVEDRETWLAAVCGVAKSQIGLTAWTRKTYE